MMKLRQVLSTVKGNDLVLVKDYLNNYEYCLDSAEGILNKVLDYNQQLRNSSVYGIEATRYNYNGSAVPMLIFSVLKD